METGTIIGYLKGVKKRIVAAFESLCVERFVHTPWKHPFGGGGEMSVLRGSVFEKVAVNRSGVYGTVFPLDSSEGPFFATGVSVITHMHNPKAPTAHMNLRFIRTEKGMWFGGGYDLTPMGFAYASDTAHFHRVAKKSLDEIDTSLYPAFARQAKEYFFVRHRNKERGVGGIFFDRLATGCFERDLAVWKAVGESFLPAVMPIFRRRIGQPYTREDKTLQNRARAHYVEFNLLYDKGTQFGFRSGGNPEAILCSLPPTACW
ncbi:MAG: oxygen-dependent coproporphyrinogen oxidase [Simkaniaceae bacterium]|nr:oxygen-dependent coproporphyrinogen oxidase [Simkaniaceae bacterium]